MASIPGFRLDITGASGSFAFLSPKEGHRCYVLPRGGYAAQDSTGTLITFDSASVASRFAVGNWIQAGLLTSNIRQVGSVGGNSINVSGAALTVSENTRIFLFGNTEPTVSGGSATYTTPNTLIRQRDDDAADLYTNSMLTTNVDGLIQGFGAPALYDLIIQDGNRANQGSVIDFEIGVVQGISTTEASIFGATVTMNAALGVTGTAVFGATVTVGSNLLNSGTGVIARLGPASFADSGGALRIVEGNTFPQTRAGVQAAINDLPSTGGKVFMPAATYTGWTTAVTIPDDVEVCGSGAATIIQKNSGSSAGIFTNSNMNGLGTGAQNNRISIRNLRIIGDSGGQTPYAIRMENVDTFWIEGVYCQSIWNGDSAAIDIDSCQHFFVRSNYINGCSNNGLKVRCQAKSSTDFVIASNIVDTTTAQNGIFVANGATFAASRFTIVGNVVKDAGDVGIEVGGTDGNTHTDWVVADNQVWSANGDGILIRNASEGVVTANHIAEGGNAASSAGIGLLSSATDCTDIAIKGNVVSGRAQGAGIRAGLSGAFRSRRISISGNVLKGASGSDDGISIQGFIEDSAIDGNVINGWSGQGIELNGSVASITDLSVSGNVITDCTSHAISCVDVDSSTFAHNVFSGNGTNGINWSGTSSVGSISHQRGTGSPEGAIVALPGSTFMRTDGGASQALYVKESGVTSSGWVAK